MAARFLNGLASVPCECVWNFHGWMARRVCVCGLFGY